MRLLKEIACELAGTFVGEPRLTVPLAALIAIAVLLVKLARADPLIGAALLLAGCPLLLIDNLRRRGGSAGRR